MLPSPKHSANGKDGYSWADRCKWSGRQCGLANIAAIEGWIIIVTNLNEETTEEDLEDHFADFGHVKNLSMALNRRTGYVMVSL